MTIIDNYKFKDLTQIGSPKDDYGLSKGLDEAVFNIPGGPDKINFYAQSQTDTDRQAMVDVLTIYKKERARLKRINDAKAELRNLLRIQNHKSKNTQELKDAIDRELKDNPVTQELKVDLGANVVSIDADRPAAKEEARANAAQAAREEQLQRRKQFRNEYSPTEIAKRRTTEEAERSKKAAQAEYDNLGENLKGGEGVYQHGGDLKQKIEKYKIVDSTTDKDKRQFVEELDEDPLYSPKNAEIGSIDRVIFIVGTYIIRMIILFMIEWGINSGMIKTFQQCFTTYIVGYIALFLVWVLLVNIRENENQENILLSTIFYYLNTRAHKSSKYRIGLHIFVQICLVPVLFIVSRKGSEIDLDSFEQRRTIYNAISQFTFFTWLMTSIIATRF